MESATRKRLSIFIVITIKIFRFLCFFYFRYSAPMLFTEGVAMNIRVLSVLPVLFSSHAFASVESTWPTTGIDPKAESVLKAYQAQCAEWAVENGLQGGDKDNYLSQCASDMSKIWPIGYGESGE